MKKERLERKGLYNPENEHDACGVGMVVNIHGNKSHELWGLSVGEDLGDG